MTLAICRGTPGPSSSTRTTTSPSPLARSRGDRAGAGENFEGVLEQVDEHALDLRGVHLDERQVRRYVDHHPLVSVEAWSAWTTIPSRARNAARWSRARLHAREIEQIADDAVEPLRLGVDRLEEFFRSAARARESGS